MRPPFAVYDRNWIPHSPPSSDGLVDNRFDGGYRFSAFRQRGFKPRILRLRAAFGYPQFVRLPFERSQPETSKNLAVLMGL
jgi:hypothetical protein